MSELAVGSIAGLAANSFVIDVAPGSVLRSNEVAPGVAGYRYVDTIYYTSNSTFTKATYPWLRAIRVKCQGAGGGGGGSVGQGAGLSGGGGAYGEAFITDIAGLDASVTVTRGAGGAGGAAGNNNGSAGGQSAFGTITADGGGGGNGSGAVTVPGGGSLLGGRGSGTTANADLTIAGGNAGQGQVLRATGVGSGGVVGSLAGRSFLGSEGAPHSGAVSGAAGSQGGGGGGGYAGTGEASIAGLAGGNGIVIVELFA
jgi:hypothetical protein